MHGCLSEQHSAVQPTYDTCGFLSFCWEHMSSVWKYLDIVEIEKLRWVLFEKRDGRTALVKGCGILSVRFYYVMQLYCPPTVVILVILSTQGSLYVHIIWYLKEQYVVTKACLHLQVTLWKSKDVGLISSANKGMVFIFLITLLMFTLLIK